jgi:hypothetical protein
MRVILGHVDMHIVSGRQYWKDWVIIIPIRYRKSLRQDGDGKHAKKSYVTLTLLTPISIASVYRYTHMYTPFLPAWLSVSL